MFKWYKCTDDNRKVNKVPVLVSTDTESIIYGDCNILSPVLKCKSYDGNYVYIEQFNRYYFITSVTWSKGYYYIHTTVDVLFTYRNSIKSLSCTVARSEKFNNPDIVDNLITVKNQRQTNGDSYGNDVISKTDTDYIIGVI